MEGLEEVEDGGRVDFDGGGKGVVKGMKNVNGKGRWVIEGWSEKGGGEMMKNVKKGDMVIVEVLREWGGMWGIGCMWKGEKGYEEEEWVLCMIEKLGGKVGVEGGMEELVKNL